MVKYDWLIIKGNANGLNINCDRRRAIAREIELKQKEKCTKPEIIEQMAIKLCVNNSISLTNFYYLQGVKY